MIVSKIRKLEALAKNNPNAAEGEAARAKAAELAKQHGITLNDKAHERFVKDYIERIKQPRKRHRSRDPMRQKIREVIGDILKGERMAASLAEEAWQRTKIKEHFRHQLKNGGVSYTDMKAFVVANGWEREWIKSRRLQGWWAGLHSSHT